MKSVLYQIAGPDDRYIAIEGPEFNTLVARILGLDYRLRNEHKAPYTTFYKGDKKIKWWVLAWMVRL